MKVFVEEQRFKNWVLIILMITPIVGILVPILTSKEEFPAFNTPKFWSLVMVSFSVVLVFLLILSIKLSTKINEQGVFYRFYPNQCKENFIPWNRIQQCHVTKYNSLIKFGGYGYRRCFWGKNKGLALNVGGKYGIQLVLENGKKILIGTQNENDAKRVLETYQSKINSNG